LDSYVGQANNNGAVSLDCLAGAYAAGRALRRRRRLTMAVPRPAPLPDWQTKSCGAFSRARSAAAVRWAAS
jgi:hypothetical protein